MGGGGRTLAEQRMVPSMIKHRPHVPPLPGAIHKEQVPSKPICSCLGHVHALVHKAPLLEALAEQLERTRKTDELMENRPSPLPALL